jgi:ATP-binding cassette subfamily B (MDR/TAP) protein 8
LPKPPQSAAAFFLEMLLPDLVLLFGAALASMGAAWSNVQISKLLGALSDSIVKLGARTSSGGAVDKAALSAAVAALSAPALALLKAYAVQGALSALYISVMSFIGERLAQRLRQRMYSALLCQDIGFFDEHRAAELTNRLTSDVQDFKSAFKSCCSTGLKASTQLLGSALALYQISPSLTILMMSVVGSMVSYLVHQMHLLT